LARVMPNQFKSKAFTTKDTKDTKVKIEETVIASLQFRIETAHGP
jgi:hypothetical protein